MLAQSKLFNFKISRYLSFLLLSSMLTIIFIKGNKLLLTQFINNHNLDQFEDLHKKNKIL